jgi:hypothetical protein
MPQYFWLGFVLLLPSPVIAQSTVAPSLSQADIPEEVLQTEIILEARSPIDGTPLSPADYAQLQDELQLSRGEVPGRVAPEIHSALVLLRLRKVLSTIFPFLF